MRTIRYETALGRKEGAVICSVDKAEQRAGPVVACRAILPPTGHFDALLGALEQSKHLTV
jgi:hypothetical protein